MKRTSEHNLLLSCLHNTYYRPAQTNWHAVKNETSAQTGPMQHVTVIIARKGWDCIKWVEVDNFWLKEKEEQKQQTTTSTRVSGHGWKPLMPMMLSTWIKLWGSLTTFVKTKRKYRWSRSFRTLRVCVAWNCLESTSSFPEVEMAISLHFGCHTWTWLRFCWDSSDHPEKETGC